MSILLLAPALAAEVSFPKDHPKVAMEVPDGWSVEYTPFGLEMKSPEKNLYIVADILPRKKAEADAWAKKAIKKLEAYGVSFTSSDAASSAPLRPSAAGPSAAPTAPDATRPEASAKIDPPPNPGAPDTAPAPPVEAAKPPAPEMTRTQEQAPSTPAPISTESGAKLMTRGAPTFTFMNPPVAVQPPSQTPAPDRPSVFSGAPSLETPGKVDMEMGRRADIPAGQTLDEILKPSEARPKLPFKVGRLPDATWQNQPIDVQIVNFGLSPKQLFLLVQASLSSDNRAVPIITSVKRAE